MRSMPKALVVAGLAVAFNAECLAATVRAYEFEIDGVLPSAEPDIELFTAGATAAEAQVYSVSGGLLHQRSKQVTGNFSYSFPDDTLTNGGILTGQSLVMEARLRILANEGVDGAFFAAFNGAHRYGLHFDASGLAYFDAQRSGGSVQLSDIANYHTYRVEAPLGGSELRLSIDGVQVYVGPAPATSGFNGFEWGDGFSAPGNGADVEWEFVRFSQPALSIVPLPSTVLLLASALAGLAAVGAMRGLGGPAAQRNP